jgi:hypothetical protein
MSLLYIGCIKFLINRFVRSLCLFFFKKKKKKKKKKKNQNKPLSVGLFGVENNK